MKEFVRAVRAFAMESGSSRVAPLKRDSAVVAREAGVGGESGEAMLQRWMVRISSCDDRAEAMMSMLSRKVVMSPERISRSESEGMRPESRAEMRSMQAWRSFGRVGAREGSVERLSMSICVERRVDRAVVRL